MLGILLIGLLILYIWWPLAKFELTKIPWNGKWWLYIDYLLIFIWLFMTITILLRANIRVDSLTAFIGLCGGLLIESWG